jgi:hypothetical protein
MIQATSFPINVTYAEKVSRQYAAAGNASSGNPGTAIVDSVTISPEGRAMNETISQAINQGETPQPLKPGEFPKLPDWSFNYNKASKRAEIGLKAAMQQLGIPAGTHVGMTTNTDGTITVTSGSAKNAELEAIVNNNPDLRNSIVAAQNSAYMGRIGNAVSQAQAAMNANPAKADYYNNWLVSTAQRISAMGFTFDFTDGKLNGSFISNGQKIGLTENLEKLAA